MDSTDFIKNRYVTNVAKNWLMKPKKERKWQDTGKNHCLYFYIKMLI